MNDEDDEEEDENRNPDAEPDIGELQPRPRKYKFKNLDDVANVKNFDDLPSQPKIDSRYVDSTGKFIMNLSTEKVLDARGRRESLNVIKHAPGPRGEAKHVTTPFEAWNLFITPDILEVVAYTNESIHTFRSKFSDDELKKSCAKNTYSKETDIVEIHAFLGLLYLRGVLRQNLRSRLSIWHHESSNDIFSATMTEKRFAFLAGLITFDDRSTRETRRLQDK